MYNRYIPQPDGSFRRSRMPDHSRPAPPPPAPPAPCPPPGQEPCPPEISSPPPKQDKKKEHHNASSQSGSIGSFLRQLLPRDLDTSDLLIILLLLLMAGDCPEDQNTALLTLAIYLFL